MIALFSKSYTIQLVAKEIGLVLPFVSSIIKKFEKFMLFSLLGEMLQGGISYKQALVSTIEVTTIGKFKKASNSFTN